MKTLLHTCCGPCASACVPALKELGREVTMLFANSNIDTREEFEKRLGEAEKLAKAEGVKIAALPYDHEEWLRDVAAGYEYEPEKGARCERCFRYNLAKTAEYAKAHGFDSFTTSLTVSPHKDSKVIFDIAKSLTVHCPPPPSASTSAAVTFLAEDFKKNEGFRRSVKRAIELGLYRQSYCGCEFSKERWTIHAKRTTESTNLDAREGRHRDVFTADYQTAGRGRLDHKWLSPAGTNLMMSVVLSVKGIPPDQVATLPLVAGLSVAAAVANTVPAYPPSEASCEAGAMRGASSRPSAVSLRSAVRGADETAGCYHAAQRGRCGYGVSLKWPNDVLVGRKKIAGILCERHGDNVIVGIGVNVGQTEFDREIADRATSLRLIEQSEHLNKRTIRVTQVRNVVLGQLGKWYGIWRERGFEAVYPQIAALDFLKGRTLSVRQTDDDSAPIEGVSNGIMPDGSLDVGGTKIYAGEAHVEKL